MAIQFVGSTSGTNTSNGTITLSLTSLSGGISSTAATDDLVVIIHGAGSTGDLNLSMSTSGYTELTDLLGNSTYDANLAVSYKKMGATPDTSAVVNATGFAAYANAAIAYVWRGVDTTNPIDVTTTTATGTNNYLPNAPSITPTTSGAVIIAAGAGVSSSSYTTPSGMSNGVSTNASASYPIAIGAASYAWSSGAYDPAAWTGGSAYILASMDGWAAASVVLRPDSGLSVSVNDAIAISENNTITIITNPNVSVFDAVAISEFSEYFRENNTASVSDTISISESKTAAKNEFPILFHDTFTGTDGTLITAHTPEIGTGWTQIITVGDGGLIIDVNTLYCEGSLNDGGLATAGIGYTYPSADYEVECIDVGSSTASDEPVTIAVRVQDANNMYTLEWTQGFFGIYKRVSGTWTQLNTGTVYPAPGDTVTLRIDGSSIKGFINGTERVSTTDTSITAAGEAGAGIGAVRLTDDDVGGGDISELKVRLISLPCSPIDSLSVLEFVLIEVTTGSTALTVSVFESVQILENITTSGVVNSFVYDAPSVTENISIVRLTPISTLQDDFDDNSIDSTKWTTWASNGTTAETNSRIELTVTPNTSSAEADLISANTYSLLGSSMTVNISQLASPGVDTAVFLQSDYGDRVMWLLNASGNAAHAVYDIDYSWVQYNSITLAAGADTYVRIREDGGTVYWDYSTNGGTSWTNAQTREVSNIIFSLNSLTAFLNVFEYSATGATTEDTSILDNFNVSITTRTVSVFDAVSISENVQTASLAIISVFDSVAIAENIQTTGSATISVFDSVAIAENIQGAGLATISVFDSVAIAENIQTAGLAIISVFDSVAIAENIQTAGLAVISVFDSVAIAENIQIHSTSLVFVFDAVVIAEDIQTDGSTVASVYDQVVTIENIQPVGLNVVSVFDSTVITESAGENLDTVIFVFDVIAIVDDIDTTGVTIISVFDAIGIAEDINGDCASIASPFDVVAVAEDVMVTTNLGVLVYDQISISESVATVTFILITTNDSVSIVESGPSSGDIKNLYATNLVSYWKLDESSGTRYDSKGSNNLSVSGTGGVGSATGKINLAADFVASEVDYLYINDGDQTGLDLTGDLSFSLWVKPDALTGMLVTKWHHISYTSYMFYFAGGSTFEFYINDNTGDYSYTGVNWSHSITTGNWYHLVLRYDASAGSAEVFVNGVSLGVKTGLLTSISNTAGVFMLGNRQNTSYPYDGLMDEVGIWSRTLTNEEISGIYNSGNGIEYEASSATPIIPVVSVAPEISDQIFVNEYSTAHITSLPISIYDAVAVVGYPQLFVGTDAAVLISELVSIQEEVVLLVPVLYVSVFDTRIIGEDIQTLVLASILVVDDVAIVENIQTSSVFFVSVFDAVATAENVQTGGLVTVSVFDVRMIGEDVQTTNSTAISVFDIRTISEDVQTANSAIISVFDTRTISEAVQAVSSAAISVFDTGTIAENVQTAGSATISVFDTMAIGEDVQIVGSAGISVFDQVAVNESSTAVTHMAVSVFDGVAITEGVAASLPTSVSTSDVIAIAETVQLQAVSQINVFDGIGMQEDVSTWAIALVSVQDIIAIQEFAGGFVSCSINVSDLIAVEDAPLVGAGSSVISIVDTISIEDVASVGAIQVDLFAYDDILLLEDVTTADVRFISVYDQITIIAILAAFPDTVHIYESVTVLVEDSGVTIGTLVFDGILLEDAVSIFSVFPIVIWDNVAVVAVLAAFPDTVHITESVLIFVEDTGVSIGGTVIDQIGLVDVVIDIFTIIGLDETYEDIFVEDVAEIIVQNLHISLDDSCVVYDADPLTAGVTEYVDVFSEVAVADFSDVFVPFYCVFSDDLVTIFPIAGAKSALTIQGIDTVTVSSYINVTSIYELVVFDTIAVEELYPDVNFNLITYFIYDPISVRERTVVYTRDAAFANLTPPEYRGRGTHGIGHGKKFSGMGEVVMAGSATRNTEQRWGAPGVGTRDRYTGTAIST